MYEVEEVLKVTASTGLMENGPARSAFVTIFSSIDLSFVAQLPGVMQLTWWMNYTYDTVLRKNKQASDKTRIME